MAISLKKNDTINLTKEDGGTLTNVRMGLGWDAKTVTKKSLFGGSRQVAESIDLDASAILIGGGRIIETVYYGHLTSGDGSVRHTGDNLTGEGDGDDESILVNLSRVPANVEHIVFVVNSFLGQTFDQVENAFVRVVDSDQGDTELASYSLSGGEACTAMVMAKVSRVGSGWTFTALGRPGSGRVAHEVANLALSSI